MKTLFLALIVSPVLIISCKTEKDVSSYSILSEPVAHLYDSALKPFYHGVASGDPLADRVIIWTRITPQTMQPTIPVKWEVSESDNFSAIFKSDTISASAQRDYTVKVDVTGLQPNKHYYYRFTALNKTSPTGRTKTGGHRNDSLKFAIVSCGNWEFGYFNAYSRIAEKNVDAVIHLGDYIYEYGPGSYGDTTIGRKHLPPNEIISLSDYRTRYSQYHLDEALREARQQHPFITIWDDHEVANNTYKEGAQNHQDNEGEFSSRKQAATQAYHEWLPIREEGRHYRSFSYGHIADLIMLDERLERSKPADSLRAVDFNDPNRSMLGAEQLVWFQDNLKQSTAVWKVIGNQVIFSDVALETVYPKMVRNIDAWDGYPLEKQHLKNFIQQQNIKNILFTTGDTHAAWAIEVATDVTKTYNPKTSKGAFAVELGTTSVSSGNGNEGKDKTTEKAVENETKLLKANPHIKYINNRDHGYLLLTLYADKAKAEWFFVHTLREIDDRETLGKKLEVAKGSYSLR